MTTLDRLPFDLLFNVISHLSIEDVVRLCLTCQQLKLLLDDKFICSRLIEKWARFSKDAKNNGVQADNSPDILRRIYETRANISFCEPVSVCVIGYGSQFSYVDGILCFLDSRNLLRVLDVHGSGKLENVIDIHEIVSQSSKTHCQSYSITAMSCCDRIATVLCELTSGSKLGWLIAIDLNRLKAHASSNIQLEPITDVNRLFVRQCKGCIVYGTHTGLRSDGHHEWVIKTMRPFADDLDLQDTYPSKAYQLKDFAGCDLGTTVAFEIHDDWLCGVANQRTFDVEEVDWTSVYHIFRCKLDDLADSFEENADVFRRQHSEGPINDSWTRLQLQKDEATNEMLIIESRREWVNSGSRQQRKFYKTPFKFKPKDKESHEPTPELDVDQPISRSPTPKFPEGDILATQLTSSDNARWKRSEPRTHHMVHSEPEPLSGSPSFSLTRTKYSCYIQSAQAFLDIVDDPLPPTASSSHRSFQRLRLRIGARKLDSPLDENGMHREAEAHPRTGKPIADSTDRFSAGAVRLWPRKNAEQEVWNILNPFSSVSIHSPEVDAIADDRSVVYMTGPQGSIEKAIILVNFDPYILLKAGKKCENWIEAADVRVSGGAEALDQTDTRRNSSRSMPHTWTEQATYSKLDRRMSFRHDTSW